MPTPLAERMSVRSGSTLRTWPSVDQVVPLLVPLPDEVVVTAEGAADAVVARCSTHAELVDLATTQLAALTAPDGGVPPLWILFPKGNRSDLNRDSIWHYLVTEHGWRPVSVVSVDSTWSALRARPMSADDVGGPTPRRAPTRPRS